MGLLIFFGCHWIEKGAAVCAGGGSQKFSQVPTEAPLQGSFQPRGEKTSPNTSQLLWTKHMGLLKFINIQWCLYLNTYLFRNLQLSAVATHIIILGMMHGFDFMKGVMWCTYERERVRKNLGKQLGADSRMGFPLWEWSVPTLTNSSGWSLARLRTVFECPGSPWPWD